MTMWLTGFTRDPFDEKWPRGWQHARQYFQEVGCRSNAQNSEYPVGASRWFVHGCRSSMWKIPKNLPSLYRKLISFFKRGCSLDRVKHHNGVCNFATLVPSSSGWRPSVSWSMGVCEQLAEARALHSKSLCALNASMGRRFCWAINYRRCRGRLLLSKLSPFKSTACDV